jgi:maleate isomerase
MTLGSLFVSMYGWRGRLGLIVPSTNSVNEPDFYRNLPEGVEVYTARMKLDEEQYREGEDEESLDSMTEDHLDRAAELVSDPEIDVVIYGCTTGSFLHGVEYDENIIDRLEEITGTPSITASSSLRKAARALDLDSVCITTPYIPNINDRARRYFEEAGFTVTNTAGLDIDVVGSSRETTSHGSVPPTEPYRQAMAAGDDADGHIISCTNFRSMETIRLIEQDLDKPVITSNQAMLWDALDTIDVSYAPADLGQLFET